MQMKIVESTQPPSAAELPAKVLERIFLELSEDDRCKEGGPQGFQSPWVPAATWVCRRWREVAIATPKLWRRIIVSAKHCDLEAISVLLERAKDEDLVIALHGADMDMTAVCASLQPHGQRIHALTVKFVESQSLSVNALLDHLGPRLSELELVNHAPASEHELSLEAELVPNLRDLHIMNIFLRPTSKMHNLVFLELESLWGVEGGQHPTEYMYEILSLCPNLSTLDLTDAMPGAHRLDKDALPVIYLPQLRELYVNELALDVPVNLANIAIPATAMLSVTARYDSCPPEWDEGESAVFPMDVLPLSRFDTLPMLAQTELLSLRLGTRGTLPDILVQGTRWSFSIPTLEDVNTGTNRLPEFTDHVLSGLPQIAEPLNIKYLDIHVAQHMPEYDKWAALLTMFPHVQALTIGSRRAFFAVMRALRDGGADILPELKQLTVCFAVPADAKTVVDARAFAAWLNIRAAAGNRLESLIVKVPDFALNETTLHLAYSLVAYASVHKCRVRVVRERCATCHARRGRKNVQMEMPELEPVDSSSEESDDSDTETVTDA